MGQRLDSHSGLPSSSHLSYLHLQPVPPPPACTHTSNLYPYLQPGPPPPAYTHTSNLYPISSTPHMSLPCSLLPTVLLPPPVHTWQAWEGKGTGLSTAQGLSTRTSTHHSFIGPSIHPPIQSASYLSYNNYTERQAGSESEEGLDLVSTSFRESRPHPVIPVPDSYSHLPGFPRKA